MSRLIINRSKLIQNLNGIKKITQKKPILAIVKSNAYGMGIVPIAQTLAQNGVEYFGVSNISEALNLRNTGFDQKILITNYCGQEAIKLAVQNKITLPIFNIQLANRINQTAKKLNQKAITWIKIDTGLGRLGLPYFQAANEIAQITKLKNLQIEGLYSTLTEDEKFDQIQLDRFLTIDQKLKEKAVRIPIKSLVSSDGVLEFPKGLLEMARVGIMLYGFYPSQKAFQERKINLEPIFEWKTQVIQINQVKKDQRMFYRLRYKPKKDTQIAVLPIGYSNGLDPKITQGGQVLIQGKKYPLVGQVLMNNSFVDLENDSNIQLGDEVVIIGKQKSQEITVEEITKVIGKSEYQILTQLSESLERKYLSNVIPDPDQESI